MEGEIEVLEQRKKEVIKKINKFLDSRHNLIFFGIMIFAFVIRLYYFSMTKTQPLWWDESDYMAYAKNLAGFNLDWIVTSQHNSLFSYLVAGFFKLGFSEIFVKFILEFIPSILLVLLTYKVCILMYEDKRIALISSFLMAVLWEMLFNSFRFHVDNPALLFGFLAMYTFFQGYEKREKIFGKINPNLAIPLTVLFVLIAYSIRRAYILFGVFFFVYLLLTKKINPLIKDKYNWIGLGVAIILMGLLEKFIFVSSLTEVGGTYYSEGMSLSLDSFQIFGTYFKSIPSSIISDVFFYLFWIGFVILMSIIVLSWDQFKKEKIGKDTKSDLFNWISIIFTLAFFIFVLRIDLSRGAGYDSRWFFPLLLGSFICISRGIIFLTDYVKKYNKQLSVILPILLICIGGFYQLQHADQIIKMKIPSYQGIREASLFLKDISNTEDIIISGAVPQTQYYSERSAKSVGDLVGKHSMETNMEEVLSAIENNSNIKYFIVTFSEPGHPKWIRNEGNGFMEIPFMDTKIDLVNNLQDIKQSKSFGNLTFNLIAIKQEVFVYEIVRN
jgi:hypothetical protein